MTNLLRRITVCFIFPEKWPFICCQNVASSSLVPVLNVSADSSWVFYKKHWYEKKVFGKFVLLFQCCILWQNFLFLSLSQIFNHPEDSFRLLNKIISIPIWQKKLENFKVYPFFPEKWFFIRRPNWEFSSLVLKIWFRLLTHLQTNLNETAIWEENCRYVSNIASLSQKNGFVFVDKIFLFEACCQYLTTHNIQVRLMADFKTSLHETPIWYEENLLRKSQCLAHFLRKRFCIRRGYFTPFSFLIWDFGTNIQSLEALI